MEVPLYLLILTVSCVYFVMKTAECIIAAIYTDGAQSTVYVIAAVRYFLVAAVIYVTSLKLQETVPDILKALT